MSGKLTQSEWQFAIEHQINGLFEQIDFLKKANVILEQRESNLYGRITRLEKSLANHKHETTVVFDDGYKFK